MGTIYEMIPKIAAEIGSIGKSQRNAQQGFNFRGIDDVYNRVGPIMAKHGVFSVPQVVETHQELIEITNKSGQVKKMNHVRVTVMYDFCASDGSSIRLVVAGESMDSGDKAVSKAMAIAHKYAFFQLFSIPVAGEDPDAESHDLNEGPSGQNGNGHSPLKTMEGILDRAVASELITPQDKEEYLSKATQYQSDKALVGYLNAVKAQLVKKANENKAHEGNDAEEALQDAEHHDDVTTEAVSAAFDGKVVNNG